MCLALLIRSTSGHARLSWMRRRARRTPQRHRPRRRAGHLPPHRRRRIAVTEYTIDADFAVGPSELADRPLLVDALSAKGFTPREHPGGWLSPDGVYIDVMVPEALAGRGRRGAELGPHGRRAARRARGLEGALVDRDLHTILSLDPADQRVTEMQAPRRRRWRIFTAGVLTAGGGAAQAGRLAFCLVGVGKPLDDP